MKIQDEKEMTNVLLIGNICNVEKILLFKPCIGIKDTCVAEG